MGEPNRDELIYDWNVHGAQVERPPHPIEFDDETLRDGLQSPSVRTPSVEERVEILRLMDALGIDTADIGLPGAGGIVREDTQRLAQAIVEERLRIAPNCAARTLESDIIPIAEIIQKTGRPIEACLFIGSSPIRQYAEGWTLERLVELTRTSVSFATRQGIPVMFVTEDTTRAHPDHIRRLYLTAIECGAKRICLCDTVGHATPNGVAKMIRFIRRVLEEEGVRDVKVDFHGHMDRGLGVWNSIMALSAGANRVHGCAIGIGERVGNTPMDQLLVNLKLMGWIENDLTRLADYAQAVSRAVGVPIPAGYPVVGRDAFETATGVHAAAVIKALRRDDLWLADRVYSGVPAAWFGRRQAIRVGPMSGKSNVIWWLEQNGYASDEAVIERILAAAKRTPRLLTDEELHALARGVAT
jgi:2-isopropylmalate synthase